MASAPRRLWLPWLLLLVPTLLIGATALWLLWQEQQRLGAAGREAQDRTVAAGRARTQVAADNIELLVSEIRDGLIRELAETPESELEPLLANWPRTNPLVAETFFWRTDRRELAWPAADTPEHTAFRQRHSELFRSTGAGFAEKARKQEKEQATTLVRQADAPALQTNAEVAQNQMLRRDVQQAARKSALEAKAQPAETESRRQRETSSVVGDSFRAAAPLPAYEGKKKAAGRAEPSLAVEEDAALAKDRQPMAAKLDGRAEAPAAPAVAGAAGGLTERMRPANGPVVPPRMDVDSAPWSEPASGWLGRTVDGTVYFLGWWQPAGGGGVRGVELNLPAVLERAQALVPAPGDGERYALLGPGAPTRDADVLISLATTLPGWRLAAWLDAPRYLTTGGGGAFFAIAALLVLAFGAAIVAGGAIFFRQAEAAAREAALKTNFVSNVSHEMKTPLTTIRMYAEMLADERVEDPAKRRRYFATIGRETTRLARLVNNALDFGRLEAGRKEYRAETIALAPWLAHLAEVQAPRLAEAGVQLLLSETPEDATVRCDADSLDQMVLNLVDNAVKYAAGGGAIDVRVEARGTAWAIVVADRGPGVPAAHRERIFERFHRVDETLTAKTTGAGLGLTIARRLARDQGGDLAYRDRNGGGAEFVLTLPAANGAA